MLDKETARIYGREYQSAVRRGRSRLEAAALARGAVMRVTGQQLGARPARALRPKLAEGPMARRCDLGIRKSQSVDVPPDRLADAERIRHLSHPTITGHLMGDPLPGRSALDKLHSGT